MPEPTLNPVAARRALESIESSAPFVRDPFGMEAFRASFLQLQELIGGLFLADPIAFWVVMGALTLLASGLAIHIGWSLLVLYRSVLRDESEPKEERRSRDFFAEAERARERRDYSRAIELAWLSLCAQFGVPLSDTPGRQRIRLERQGPDGAPFRALQSLHEQALYSGRSPSNGDVTRMLELVQRMKNR